MPSTIKFHLDENCDPRIAVGLRRRGIDATTTIEAGLLHSTDEEQLAFAVREGRTIVTQDADFLRLNAAGTSHFGIVYRPHRSMSIGEIIRRLIIMWEFYDPEEMQNRVEFL